MKRMLLILAVMLAVAFIIISCREKNQNKTHTHKYGTEWLSNVTYHWNECDCGEKSNVAEHEGKPCSICGYEYKIGDNGPAGGIIFYDKGELTVGWRYLEAAPEDISGTYQWGADGFIADVPFTVNGTSIAIGKGLENTNIIVSRFAELGETDRAAQVCVAYTHNGYDDWFLPSKDELNLMYQNLHIQGFGGFSTFFYWSSSAYEGSGSWGQSFGFGYMANDCYRGYNGRVRCVRRF